MACKVLVVCGSPVVASADLLRRLAGECDHVIAVDRGLDALLGAGLGCDVYVGDADTVSDEGRALVDAAEDFEVERHDPYKDFTDLALALDTIRRRWLGAEVVATCATGGRPDMAARRLRGCPCLDCRGQGGLPHPSRRRIVDHRRCRGQDVFHHRHSAWDGGNRARPRVGTRSRFVRPTSRHGHQQRRQVNSHDPSPSRRRNRLFAASGFYRDGGLID